MKGILFLSHRLPFPPNKGDKIRSFHIMRALKKQAPLYLGTFIDDPHDWGEVKHVLKDVTDACILERESLKKKFKQLCLGLFRQTSLSEIIYASKSMQMWVDDLVEKECIDAIYVYSSVMAQYVLKYQDRLPIYTDFVDVDSQKWQAYSEQKCFPLNYIYRLESKKLMHFEKHVAACSKVNIFVSNQEAKVFKALAPSIQKPIIGIRNGVNTDFFDPQLTFSQPFPKEGPVLVFTGLMNYWPNEQAVNWFVKYVFNAIEKRHPNIEFYIVGANPTPSVFALRRKNIHITGRVPDVRPYIQHADLIIAPLRIARGLQNKVLEAMSMNKPIIATPQALEGIESPPKDGLMQASHADQWCKTLLAFLESPPKKLHLRTWILKNYAWENSLRSIEALVIDKNQVAES